MHITHFGHSALLLTYPGADAGRDTRILIDPGAFSDPKIAELRDIDAILISHQHADHAHPPFVAKLAANNPDAEIIVESQTAEALSAAKETEHLVDRFAVILPGSHTEIGPVAVSAAGGAHAIIHPAIPAVGNVAFILEAPGEKSFAHTGDSIVPHPEILGIDVLSFPVVAPWSKMQETIDFLRVVKPALALPVHDAVASAQGRAIYLKQSTEHALEGTEVRDWPALDPHTGLSSIQC